MTIRERLQIIGQVLTNTPVKKEVVKVVKEKKEKSASSGFLDFEANSLSTATTISQKLIGANRGWVYRNNDVIAKEVSNLEPKLYSVKTVAQELVYTEVTQHPLLDALDRFNDFTSAPDAFYTTQSHKKLTGDAFWYIEGRGPNIRGIYNIPPDKVTIKLDRVKGQQIGIKSYEYEDTVDGKRISITYKPEEVIHFKVPNPANSFRGLGAVEAAADAIDTDNLAIEANKKLFQRGLISNFILTTEMKLTADQLKQLHAEFKNSYQGIQNAFKVPILSGGLKPENIQMSNKDLEFIKQQEWVRDKITAVFGNNKAVIGVTDDVNRANAEASILDWKRTTIRSEMKAIVDTLNEFLVPRFGDNLLLGFEDPVEEDKTTNAENVKKLIEAKVITVNEAREIVGLDAIPGQDELPQTQAPVIEVPKALKYINRQKLLRRSGVYKKIEEFNKLKEAAKPYAEELVKKKAAKPEKVELDRETIHKNYWEKQLRAVEQAEAIFEGKVTKFIQSIVEKGISNLPSEIKNIQNKALLDEEELITQATLDLAPVLKDVARTQGEEALQLIDIELPYVTTDINKVIEDRVRLFATSMIETDRDQMIDIISNGIKQGQSVPEIGRSIRSAFETYTKNQATRITRTEVINASNIAAVDAWKQTGVVTAKEWKVAYGADAECAQFDGEIVQIDGPFYQKTMFANGNPPIHPNCRCVLLPVLFDDKKVNLWNDERGNIDFASSKQTFYHGTNNADLTREVTDLFGDALYVSRDKSIAAEFGDVTKLKANIKESDILRVANQEQHQKLVDSAIKYANRRGGSVDTYTAIPKYIRSLGYKAVEALPDFDPYGGLAIVDKALRQALERKLKAQVSDEITKLKLQIEKETGEKKELEKKIQELTEYNKELEVFLDED